MTVAITAIYASLTALMIVVFTWRVIKERRATKTGLGDGGNESLQLANRVHGNLLENAPIVLILMLLAELGGLSSLLLNLAGGTWLFARLLHAVGLTQGRGGIHPGRFWGVLLTWGVILFLAGANLYLALMALAA
ncbi:MAPEG family protein [Shewanella corallii]|uniref:MAPEG family protein n=2 Tax=Shewanella TaxID=22 RepID=A0ABT0NDQ5_9GAMM|nr:MULTISPECIES: MAPEG family protein [Shewanella]MCL1039424.1 MAPEG family protein [Shewanella submarina]MCL2916250.1 MAPEG family protein [Shewanella corallii]